MTRLALALLLLQACNSGMIKVIPRDELVLECRLSTSREIQCGDPVFANLMLVNASQSRSFRVVKPGDGSMVGWREPYVHYTADVDRGDGVWREVDGRTHARCGHFNSAWNLDVVDLGPGMRLPIIHHVDQPSHELSFAEPGRYRLRGHYAYRGDGDTKPAIRIPRIEGPMKRIAPFEVVSEPVEIHVTRSVKLRLAPLRTLKAGRTEKLSDVIGVVFLNGSSQPETICPRFEIEIEGAGAAPIEWDRPLLPYVVDVVNPGQSRALLGPQAPDPRDAPWTLPSAGMLRMRALGTRFVRRIERPIESDWVEIRVEP